MITQIDIEFIKTTTDDSIDDNKYDKIKKVCSYHAIIRANNSIYDIPLLNKRTLINYFKICIDNLK